MHVPVHIKLTADRKDLRPFCLLLTMKLFGVPRSSLWRSPGDVFRILEGLSPRIMSADSSAPSALCPQCTRRLWIQGIYAVRGHSVPDPCRLLVKPQIAGPEWEYAAPMLRLLRIRGHLTGVIMAPPAYWIEKVLTFCVGLDMFSIRPPHVNTMRRRCPPVLSECVCHCDLPHVGGDVRRHVPGYGIFSR
ncbi:hypothetical protein BV22DRAFT_749194 [Leucogyrophana mollusca]|uniref:Uncharacterized protein n=1 Tax=Leucogyrophana mollusca TaxID=85980 RepID=A0ACB8B682_9AGAM|nr:hypothetical protein BV22DRAFT_749194 [Leucogyrophana mollusca]